MTFSRVFPSHHPRKGEPTYFVEKILKSIYGGSKYMTMLDIYAENFDVSESEFLAGFCNPFFDHIPKHHTIRAGHRWKVGDKFSPRVWYRSKQIIIAPDIEVKKVWNFEVVIYNKLGYESVRLNDLLLHEVIAGQIFMGGHYKWRTIAKNDGLEFEDFGNWFNKSFSGQIVCWNDQIEY
jgi:hypothetical protein